MVTQVKAVVFDQGGVLSLGGEKGANEKAAAQVMGLPNPIVVPDLIEALKRGQIGNNEFIDEINRRYPNAPNKCTDEMWNLIHSWWLKPDERSYRLAAQCRASGRRVGLLSNINPAMVRLLRADGSYKGFDPLVLSCMVGCAKPDPEIYAVVEAGLSGIKPGEILLLDDQQKCIDGARRQGWQAMLVTDLDKMVRDVTSLLSLG